MNHITKITIHSLMQVALATCIFVSSYGQYTNQQNITPSKFEYTFNYNWENGTLTSVSTVQDSLWDNYGYGSFHFKQYDEDFNAITKSIFIDTGYIYGPGRDLLYLDGFYYTGGFKDSANYASDTTSSYLLKFDSLGNQVWNLNYHSELENVDVKQIVQRDSLLFLCGVSFDSVNFSFPNKRWTHIWAVDTANGNIVWEKNFKGFTEQPLSFKSTADGGFLLTTYIQPFTKTRVYKLDGNANVVWQTTLGTTIYNNDYFTMSAAEMPNGNTLCYGNHQSLGEKSWLVELDNNGVVIKDTVLEITPVASSVNSFVNDLDIIFKDNGFYVVGSTYSYNTGIKEPYLCFFNYNFEMQWVKRYQARGYDDIIVHMELFPPDTSFIFMAGISFSDPNIPGSTADEWFLVVDSLGCDVTSCWNSIAEQEEDNTTFKIYPNPIHSGVELSLEMEYLNLDHDYYYTITDLRGRLVDNIPINATYTRATMNHLNSGIYVVHLYENGATIHSQKLVVTD